jgi:outer membrane protein assembly factor BamB
MRSRLLNRTLVPASLTECALKASTGAKLWSYKFTAVPVPSSPVVVNGVVYVGSADDRMYAFGLK